MHNSGRPIRALHTPAQVAAYHRADIRQMLEPQYHPPGKSDAANGIARLPTQQ